MSQLTLECKLPTDPVIVMHKFTDFPLDSIWCLVFVKSGYGSAMDPRKVRNFDELEIDIQSIAELAIQKQNILFLQQLSEESNRTDNASITIFAI